MTHVTKITRSVSGKKWSDKIHEVRVAMHKAEAIAVVVTALDEVACEFAAPYYCPTPHNSINRASQSERIRYQLQPSVFCLCHSKLT